MYLLTSRPRSTRYSGQPSSAAITAAANVLPVPDGPLNSATGPPDVAPRPLAEDDRAVADPADALAQHGDAVAGKHEVVPARPVGHTGGAGRRVRWWWHAEQPGRHAARRPDHREWPGAVALDEAEPQQRRLVGPHRRQLAQFGGGDIEQLLEQRAGRIRLRRATLELLVQPADARLDLGRDHAGEHVVIEPGEIAVGDAIPCSVARPQLHHVAAEAGEARDDARLGRPVGPAIGDLARHQLHPVPLGVELDAVHCGERGHGAPSNRVTRSGFERTVICAPSLRVTARAAYRTACPAVVVDGSWTVTPVAPSLGRRATPTVAG